MRKKDEEMKKLIQATIDQTIKTVKQGNRNYYKETENRLYNYLVLKERIIRLQNDLADLKIEPVSESSKSIVRFSQKGIRLTPEEIQQARIIDLEYRIEEDKKLVLEIEKGLQGIDKDEYKNIIIYRYFDKMEFDIIAEKMNCDIRTAYRQRRRLIDALAVCFFGSKAL